MSTPIAVVDLFTPIVDRISTKLLPQLMIADPNITGVWYKYGHPKEIIELLGSQSLSPSVSPKRYPLIALFQDFAEIKGELGYDSKVKLHMIIASRTDNSYRAEQRYSKNFKPILYPIYEELLRQLTLPKTGFTVYGDTTIKHVKIDRLYWGNKGLEQLGDGKVKNVFNDWLDVIEIKDLELTVNTKKC